MKNKEGREELVEGGGEAGEILLSLVEQVEGVGLQGAVRGEFQIGLGIS